MRSRMGGGGDGGMHNRTGGGGARAGGAAAARTVMHPPIAADTVAHSPIAAAADAADSDDAGAWDVPVCVSFGSMGSVGVIRDPDALVRVIGLAMSQLGRCGCVCVGGGGVALCVFVGV